MRTNPKPKLVLLMLLLVPHLKPGSIEYIAPGLDMLLDGLRVVSFAVMVVAYAIWMARGKKLPSILVILVAYEGVLLLSTVLNQGNYWSLAIQVGSILTICMITLMMLESDTTFFYSSMTLIYELFIYANLLTLFLFPEGMYTPPDRGVFRSSMNWLLGYRNIFVLYFLPGMLFTTLRSYQKRGESQLDLRAALLIASCFVSFVAFPRAWSATTVFVLGIFVVYLILPKRIKTWKFFTSRTYVWANLVGFVSVILLRIQNYFAFFIEGVLRRDVTFTTRTFIWDRTMAYITQKPFLGYGVYDARKMTDMIDQIHAHNQYLDAIFQGGILGLALFLAFIIVAAIYAYKHRGNILVGAIAFAMLCVLVEWQVESIGLAQFIPIFLLAFSSGTVAKQFEARLKPEPNDQSST